MKYFIKTFGCQQNFSDSERIASFLESYKLAPIGDITNANLAVFNTCGVRQTAEDRVYGQIHNLRKANTEVKIVVTGCLASRKDVQRKLKNKVDLFIPIKNFFALKLENLELFINYKLKINNSGAKITNCGGSYFNVAAKYEDDKKISVPIMSGCNNFCSYCVVPYARGRELSRPVEDIVQEIDTAHKKGCKEVLLLGQNVNSYSFIVEKQFLKFENSKLNIDWKLEIGNWKFKHHTQSNNTVDFPLLLGVFAKIYPNIHWSFLTSHPKDFSAGLIDVIAKNENISRNIHLPIQSGSNKILRAMNRPYTQKHYLRIIAKIAKKIPDAKFSTDVIVGFPGETEKDFQNTVEVFRKVKYTEAYINKYSPRPGTAALQLGDPIPWEEKKRREKILRSLIEK